MLLDYISPSNLITAICISDYLFNVIDSFKGVHFKSGVRYFADKTHLNYQLMSVLQINEQNHKEDVVVGMSIETFNKHFKEELLSELK